MSAPTQQNPAAQAWVIGGEGGIVVHTAAEEEVALAEIFAPVSLSILSDQEANITPVRQGLFRRIGNTAMKAFRNTIITAETTFPINEAITYAPPIAAALITKDPVLTGLAAGAPTMALEWLGGHFGAGILGRPNSQPGTTADGSAASGEPVTRERGKAERIIDKILDSRPLSMLIPRRGERIDPVTLGLVTLYGGTVAGQKLKERENSDSTQKELRRFNNKAALILGAACAAEAVVAEEGLVNWDHPYVSGPAGLALVAAWLGLRRLRQRAVSRNEQAVMSEADEIGRKRIAPLLTLSEMEANRARPNYSLGEEELGLLEEELVRLVKERNPEEGVAGVWIRPDSKFANFVRAHEAQFFDEVSEVTDEDESHTLFLALVDTRSSDNRIVHGGTVMGVTCSNEGQLSTGSGTNNTKSGFYTVDELVRLGNFKLEDFHEYYESQEIDVNKSISVETNFVVRRQGHRSRRFEGLRGPELAYLMFFNLLQTQSPQLDRAAVFCSINPASANSFERFGISYQPLMGRDDFVTPESLRNRKSLPIAIPYDAHNQALFNRIQLPEYFV